METRKKRTNLSLKRKLEIISQAQLQGLSVRGIVKNYGIEQSTAYKLLKQKEVLLEIYETERLKMQQQPSTSVEERDETQQNKKLTAEDIEFIRNLRQRLTLPEDNEVCIPEKTTEGTSSVKVQIENIASSNSYYIPSPVQLRPKTLEDTDKKFFYNLKRSFNLEGSSRNSDITVTDYEAGTSQSSEHQSLLSPGKFCLTDFELELEFTVEDLCFLYSLRKLILELENDESGSNCVYDSDLH